MSLHLSKCYIVGNHMSQLIIIVDSGAVVRARTYPEIKGYGNNMFDLS